MTETQSQSKGQVRDNLGMAVTVAENSGFNTTMSGFNVMWAMDNRGKIWFTYNSGKYRVTVDDSEQIETEDFKEAFEEYCELVI